MNRFFDSNNYSLRPKSPSRIQSPPNKFQTFPNDIKNSIQQLEIKIARLERMIEQLGENNDFQRPQLNRRNFSSPRITPPFEAYQDLKNVGRDQAVGSNVTNYVNDFQKNAFWDKLFEK